jgi:serine/threonine-protein kinase
MTLKREQMAVISRLLDEALVLDEAGRRRWLQDLPSEHQQLAGSLRAALFPEPARRDSLGTLPKIIASEDSQTLPSGLEGTRVGPYRVLSLLGYGGMGSVWLAERADGLFTRRVALKLIHPALKSRVISERFTREREILASLNHPNIARLLDAGFTDDGQSYLALDYVAGAPLTTYCDERRLGTRERLELFRQVLSAVQYAHANLVIHRDLKPANILVTEEGQVQLLDFGIAKLLTEGEAKETELTQLGGRALTPDYAAPEQIAGAPVTTAADVYALGVMLYELLTGERPYRLKRDSRGALEEAILRAEPVAPSRAASSEAAAAARATTAKKLSSSLRGDLDTIAIKAMKKSPAERYPTVNAFGEDIERFLRGDVVLAQPDSAVYRALKFARRHWVGIAVTSALILTLTGGLAATFYQAQRAEREGRKATAVKEFLIDIFKQSSVENPGGVEAKKVTAEQLLDLGARRIRVQLHDQPEVREELMDTLASLNNDLGLIDRAQTLAADNLAELRARTGGRPSVELARLEISLASAMINRNQKALTAEAQEYLHKALADLQAVGAGDSVEAATAYYQLGLAAYDSTLEGKADGKRALLRALDILTRRDHANPLRGDVFKSLAEYATFERDAAEAEHWLNEQLAFQTAQGEERNGFAIGDAYFNLAEFQTEQGHFDVAEGNYHHAIVLLTKAAGADHPETADARARLGEMYLFSDRAAEAEPLLRGALESDVRTPQGVSNATEHRRTLAYVEFARGRWPEAEQLLRQDLAELKGNLENELRWGITASGLVRVLIVKGELSEARELHDKSMDVYRRYMGEKSRDYGWCLTQAGLLALAEHKPYEAVAIFERVLKDWPSSEGALTHEYTRPTLGLAAAYLDLDRPDDARRYANEVLTRVRAAPAPNQSRELEAQTLRLLGEALRRSGRAGEAERPLRKAVELRESLDDDAVSPWLAQARLNLAECLIAIHQKAEAQSLIRKAAAALSRQPQLLDTYRQDLQRVQAMIGG